MKIEYTIKDVDKRNTTIFIIIISNRTNENLITKAVLDYDYVGIHYFCQF